MAKLKKLKQDLKELLAVKSVCGDAADLVRLKKEVRRCRRKIRRLEKPDDTKEAKAKRKKKSQGRATPEQLAEYRTTLRDDLTAVLDYDDSHLEGYGFCLAICFDQAIVGVHLVEKFKARWDVNPSWFYFSPQGPSSLIMLGPLPSVS